MNKRFASVIIFAFVTAALTSAVLYKVLANKLNASTRRPASTVLVAARNLDTGLLLHDTDFRMSDWPGKLPAGAIQKKEDLAGRGVVSTILEGEPIVESRLAPKGAGAGLAATIPVGMRAVAVRVNEIVGVSGFVLPGMRVDLIVMGNPPAADVRTAQGTVTKTVLQNIMVLSAGQKIEHDAEGKPIAVSVVNLLVTPDQAELLTLASNETRIQLVLRNPLDTKEEKTSGTNTANLFSGRNGLPSPAPPVARSQPRPRPTPAVQAAAPPPPPKATPPVTVELFQGARKTEASFQPNSENN